MAGGQVGMIETDARVVVAADHFDRLLDRPVLVRVNQVQRHRPGELRGIGELHAEVGVPGHIVGHLDGDLDRRFAERDDVAVAEDREVHAGLIQSRAAAGVEVFQQHIGPRVDDDAVGVADVLIVKHDVGGAARADHRHGTAEVPGFLPGRSEPGGHSNQRGGRGKLHGQFTDLRCLLVHHS